MHRWSSLPREDSACPKCPQSLHRSQIHSKGLAHICHSSKASRDSQGFAHHYATISDPVSLLSSKISGADNSQSRNPGSWSVAQSPGCSCNLPTGLVTTSSCPLCRYRGDLPTPHIQHLGCPQRMQRHLHWCQETGPGKGYSLGVTLLASSKA